MASLYHEKQVSLLCGQHALNSLLQGPYFTAEDLTAIAREFDDRERALMREAGLQSKEYLQYIKVNRRTNVPNALTASFQSATSIGIPQHSVNDRVVHRSPTPRVSRVRLP